MRDELFDQVVEQLEQISPRKAKKLRILIEKEKLEEDPIQKRKYRRKLFTYLNRLFMSCLTRESRNLLANLTMIINEECYNIESQADDRWHISYEGAIRYIPENGKLVEVGRIPRQYQKGFYIDEEIEKSEEEKQAEYEFYHRFFHKLYGLGFDMDNKQELITGRYQIKDSRISKEFVELLITTLGLKRIGEEKVNSTEVQKQKS